MPCMQICVDNSLPASHDIMGAIPLVIFLASLGNYIDPTTKRAIFFTFAEVLLQKCLAGVQALDL